MNVRGSTVGEVIVMLECKGFLENGITLWQEETFFLGISVPFVTSVVLRSVLYGMWFVDYSCVLPIVNSLFMLTP